MSTINSRIISNTCQYNELFMASHNSRTQEISLMQKRTQMKKELIQDLTYLATVGTQRSLQTTLEEVFYQKQIYL